jgi:Flp pilus assembly protein TadB
VLLATASNLKAGLSVYSALERAIQLLDENSRIKAEIRSLLEQVSRGVPKEVAVSEFAEGIDLPELRLFKRAFILVLVHGGKFSRTLERLSEVCRDRDALVKSANVSTASMRMTANVLLAIAPLLMLVLSFRTKGFWTILFENSIASGLGIVGASIIIGAFFILRKLSDFKP